MISQDPVLVATAGHCFGICTHTHTHTPALALAHSPNPQAWKVGQVQAARRDIVAVQLFLKPARNGVARENQHAPGEENQARPLKVDLSDVPDIWVLIGDLLLPSASLTFPSYISNSPNLASSQQMPEPAHLWLVLKLPDR